MSTEFRSNTTEELAFVRFFGGAERGSCFEFGTVTNFEGVCQAMDAGETFFPEPGQGSLAGDPTDRTSLEALVVEGRVTFGEFCFTVALGSGDMLRFTQEELA